MDKKIKFGTKMLVMLLSFILAGILVLNNVVSVTREITSDNDDVITYIQNSDGNYWTTNVANLTLAMDDLGDNATGKITVGSDITSFDTTININERKNLTIDFQEHRLILSDDVAVFNITASRHINIENVDIIVPASVAQTHDLIMFYCGYGNEWGKRIDECKFTNVNIYSENEDNKNFSAINMTMDGDKRMTRNDFIDFYIFGVKSALEIYNKGDGGYIDRGVYRDFTVYDYETCIDYNIGDFDENDGGINQMHFEDWIVEPGSRTKVGVHLEGADRTVFRNFLVSDFNAALIVAGEEHFHIDKNCSFTDIEVPYILKSGGEVDYGRYIDDGNYTKFYSYNYGYINDFEPTNFTVWRNGSMYYARNENGQREYYDTDFQNLMYSVSVDTEGGQIYLKTGAYECDSTIEFSSNTTIRGESKYNTEIYAKAGETFTALFSFGTRDDNIHVSNLKFDGNTRGASVCFGISMAKITNATVENCVFTDFLNNNQGAIKVSPGTDDICKNIFIRNNEFYSNEYAIDLNGVNPDHYISEVIVTGNIIEDGEDGIRMDYCGNSTITNNIIKDMTSECVYLENRCNNNSITNNVMITTGEGVDIDDENYHNIFALNSMKQCTTTFEGTGQECHFEINMGDDI